MEVFGGSSVAVLEDFRRLELVRGGKAQVFVHGCGRTKAIAENGWHSRRRFAVEVRLPIVFEESSQLL